MAEHGIDLIDEAGDFRHQLQYQAFAPAGRDAYGKPSGVWSTLAT